MARGSFYVIDSEMEGREPFMLGMTRTERGYREFVSTDEDGRWAVAQDRWCYFMEALPKGLQESVEKFLKNEEEYIDEERALRYNKKYGQDVYEKDGDGYVISTDFVSHVAFPEMYGAEKLGVPESRYLSNEERYVPKAEDVSRVFDKVYAGMIQEYGKENELRKSVEELVKDKLVDAIMKEQVAREFEYTNKTGKVRTVSVSLDMDNPRARDKFLQESGISEDEVKKAARKLYTRMVEADMGDLDGEGDKVRNAFKNITTEETLLDVIDGFPPYPEEEKHLIYANGKEDVITIPMTISQNIQPRGKELEGDAAYEIRVAGNEFGKEYTKARDRVTEKVCDIPLEKFFEKKGEKRREKVQEQTEDLYLPANKGVNR